jgi:hypothetical protein
MSEITSWIDEAGKRLGVTFSRCSDDRASTVVAAARARFVTGNPRVWWLSLARPSRSYDSAQRSFLDVVPERTERVWFIAEDESNDCRSTTFPATRSN